MQFSCEHNRQLQPLILRRKYVKNSNIVCRTRNVFQKYLADAAAACSVIIALVAFVGWLNGLIKQVS